MADLIQAWLESKCPLAGLPSARALQALSLYAVTVWLLGVILPGPTIQGTTLSDGTRLNYKCNGLLITLASSAILISSWNYGALNPSYIADLGGELFSTTLLISVALSAWLYLVGTTSQSTSSSLKSRSHGGILLDFWLGTQLNPMAFGVLDLKWFILRLGMLGWLILNLAVAAKQLQGQGSLSLSMMLYQAFANFYVLDFFWFEEAMTTTWDIIAECFGFMLVFGDLVWIPYTFSLQAWWLLQHDPQISPAFAAVAVATFAVGFSIFRGSNSQKHAFKKDPTQKIWGNTPLVVGGKLLASGWWGIARKCNYLGDLLVALSFSLPCGLTSAVPYFYPIYLFILLIQRERRDEAKCREKYREIWKEYCSKVPWRIFPYIY